MSENDLSPKQQQALMLLLAGNPQADVAHAVGISCHTLARWRHHHPCFRQHYQDALLALREAALIEAHAGGRESFQFLRGVVANATYDPQCRINVAKFLAAAAVALPTAADPCTGLPLCQPAIHIENVK